MSEAPFRIAVFASGSGSNFQAIADAVKEGRLDVTIELLVCDRPKAKVVERAKEAGVPVYTFSPKEYASRQDYEREILRELRERQVELVVLAGYMRILTEVLVDAYWGRMINIHPSLLPSFPGLHAVRQALAHGVKVTGVTVHLVDGGLDSGPILAQRALPILDGDTEESLEKRIHPIEHVLYPQVIGDIAQGIIDLDKIVKAKANNSTKDGMSNQ
ncbi:phosphoribosylglycinamide formyltransferase-1 [Paenibacillus sp. UNCCL117]|uniref:phosphoribosylglycinamide formyltransferase n=1 Tax=unclassified Paenibacillus TaxID=185978 RepID=UPI000886125D|nr:MULTISPECIES: phosphoribosylglycinamide formyltransferase [unclassified Paenibacillus]SDE08570.1 phosphoribosylglycinamide formyltransferase-1 [Paenibacillus sp. cl123]SFW58927.1 phosphoribosylglycinamide formyltransferase-1 [Paenibacillus sp. UNCCL117]